MTAAVAKTSAQPHARTVDVRYARRSGTVATDAGTTLGFAVSTTIGVPTTEPYSDQEPS